MLDLLSGRLPPVEEEIVAVEDSLAGRTSDHLAHRRNDFQLHDHSPYCASTSTSSVAVAASAATASAPQTLLNYLQMDQASPSYLLSPQFSHAHRSLTTQQHSQSQQQYQQHSQEQLQLQQQPQLNETVFSHAPKATSTSLQVLSVLNVYARQQSTE